MNEKGKNGLRNPTTASVNGQGGDAAALSPSKAVEIFSFHGGEVIADMVQGMRTLLAMHNSHELIGLCNALCMPRTDNLQSNAMRIEQIFRSHLLDEKGYIKVLSFVWEGTIIEYLRSEGIQLKLSVDPRLAVLNHWRKGRQRANAHFIPIYVPRTFLPVPTPTPRDEKIVSFLTEIEEHEKNLKVTETAIRRERDFRNVLAFMATLYELRKAEKEGRNYLLDKLRTAQSELLHNQNTLMMTSCQLLELDARHEALLKATLDKEATLETVDNLYLEMASSEAAMRSHFEDLYWDTRFGTSCKLRDLSSRLAATNKELILTKTELEKANEAIKAAERKAKSTSTDLTVLQQANSYLIGELARNEFLAEENMHLALAVGDRITRGSEEAIGIFAWLKGLPQTPKDYQRKLERLMFLTGLTSPTAYCATLEAGMMVKNDVNMSGTGSASKTPKRGNAPIRPGGGTNAPRGPKASITSASSAGKPQQGKVNKTSNR